MTEQQAADLLDRIDTLTESVRVADEQARQTHSLAKRLRIAFYVLACLVVLIGGGALELSQQQDEIESSRVQQCENGNATRAGQRAIWDFFFEVTIAANADAPPAVLKFYDDYVAWIKTDVLPDRDCSDLSKTYPEPGPPPSYEDALREALKQERE